MTRHKLGLGLLLWAFMALQAAAEEVRIVVISDLNGSYGSTDYSDDVHRAVDAIIALSPDLVISTGDMVAGQRRPALSEEEIRAMWRSFHTVVTDPLARSGIPLAVTPGNHDGSAYPGFEPERRIYAEEWEARRPKLRFVNADNYPYFYAFDIGPARIVSIDATRTGPLDAVQMNELATAFDGQSAVRIVFGHLPLWPFTVGRETDIIGDPALETLFGQVGVNLYLSGHHHAFYPGQLEQISVVSQAGLGGGSRKLIGSEDRGPKSFTLMEISPEGSIRLAALEAPDFRTSVGVQYLPQSLDTKSKIIRRIDTVPSGAVQMAD